MTLRTILGVALLAASTLTFAQAPGGGAPTEAQKKERMERREKMRSAHQEAMKACEGKQGEERRSCMRTRMCAQSKDPAKCEAGAKARMASRQKAREACKGKEGDALKSCIREQRSKK